MIPRGIFRFALVLLIASCGGCTSFDPRWKAAATSTTAERWDGRWSSEKHHTPSGGPEGGRLRAVTEPAPNKGLTAHFHANWLIFATDYSMTFQSEAAGPGQGKGRAFRGTQELPKMFGGTYRYDARLAGNDLIAHYNSSYDHGTFTLHRVDPPKDCAPARARH